LTLLRHLSLFHSLGVPLLLGASRKGFIGAIGEAPEARRRMPGSIAVGLAALAQGVHILRVHDVAETAQAIRLWQAVR
jgi:dihydropteroate synthase